MAALSVIVLKKKIVTFDLEYYILLRRMEFENWLKHHRRIRNFTTFPDFTILSGDYGWKGAL